jgi:hypothetical protein
VKNSLKIIGLIIGLGVAFASIFLAIYYFQLTRNDNMIFVQNGRELTYIIRDLEDEQVVSLNDITPFDWDHLYVFGAYVSPDMKQERMGIDEQYLLNNPQDGTSYVYFMLENELVASMLGSGYGYSILFDFSLADEQTPWLQALTIYPSDNLEFLVTTQHLPDDSEIKVLQLGEEENQEQDLGLIERVLGIVEIIDDVAGEVADSVDELIEELPEGALEWVADSVDELMEEFPEGALEWVAEIPGELRRQLFFLIRPGPDFHGWERDKTRTDELIESLQQAINAQDREMIMSLFSERALEEVADLEQQTEELVILLENGMEIQEISSYGGSQRTTFGRSYRRTRARVSFTSNGVEYRFWLSYTLVNQFEPERVGLERLVIAPREIWESEDFRLPSEPSDGIHFFF